MKAELTGRVSNLRSSLKASEWARDGIKSALEKSEKQCLSIAHQSSVLDDASKFLQAVAEKKEGDFRQRIERIVQYGLDSVFGAGKYHFVVRLNTLAGRRSVEIGFVDDKADPSDPDAFTEIVDSHGGSVVVIVSYFLQIALLLFSKSRPIVIADEKFLMLDDTNSVLLPEVINKISKDLGIQTILVTHEAPLAEACESCVRLTPSDKGVMVTKRG